MNKSLKLQTLNNQQEIDFEKTPMLLQSFNRLFHYLYEPTKHNLIIINQYNIHNWKKFILIFNKVIIE